MDFVAYSQYYRTSSPERQLEIDECLRRNNTMVLFCESDVPPVPEGTVPVEVVNSDERITYAEWFRWVKRQGTETGLLVNPGIRADDRLRDDYYIYLATHQAGPVFYTKRKHQSGT